MANNPKITNAAAIAACNAIVDLVDGGSGAGKLRIYSGSQPANADTAASGTLLAELTMDDPAFGNAADGTGKATATASTITADSAADDTGVAGYARLVDSDGNAVIDLEVGTSGCDLNLNTTSLTAGVEVSVSSLTFSVSES